MHAPTAGEVLTIPNAISAAGFGMAVHGAARIDTPIGVAEVVAGRLLDLADGPVARRTGQTSEFGAAVDATLDKLGGLAIIAGLWRHDAAPKPVLAAIVAQNAANTAATAIAAKRHPKTELAPTRNGKHAMGWQNAALFTYAAANLVKDIHPRAARAGRFLAGFAAAVGVGYYGARATAEYFRRSR